MCVEGSFNCLFILLGEDLHDKAILSTIPKIPLDCDHHRWCCIEIPPLKLYISQIITFIHLGEKPAKQVVAPWDGNTRDLESETACCGGVALATTLFLLLYGPPTVCITLW